MLDLSILNPFFPHMIVVMVTTLLVVTVHELLLVVDNPCLSPGNHSPSLGVVMCVSLSGKNIE